MIKSNYLLIIASIIVFLLIFFHTNNEVEINQEMLKYIELDRSQSQQKKSERQYQIVIMIQQTGYIVAFMLIPMGFSLYQNRSTFKRYKRKLNNVFKSPRITRRKSLTESLIVAYPHLTTNDLNLCNLVYQGLSSKDIAHQLNISAASANTARYRLRKKLNIRSNEDLTKFLHKI